MATHTLHLPGLSHTRSKAELALITVETIFGIGAVGGGIGLLTGSVGLSKDFLAGTPFDSYLIPGLALLVFVGGSMLGAAWNLWKRSRYALYGSLAAAAMIAGWFVVQLGTVGYISWMQPAFIGLGLIQMALTWLVFRPERQSAL
jgi:hypothetical protein